MKQTQNLIIGLSSLFAVTHGTTCGDVKTVYKNSQCCGGSLETVINPTFKEGQVYKIPFASLADGGVSGIELEYDYFLALRAERLTGSTNGINIVSSDTTDKPNSAMITMLSVIGSDYYVVDGHFDTITKNGVITHTYGAVGTASNEVPVDVASINGELYFTSFKTGGGFLKKLSDPSIDFFTFAGVNKPTGIAPRPGSSTKAFVGTSTMFYAAYGMFDTKGDVQLVDVVTLQSVIVVSQSALSLKFGDEEGEPAVATDQGTQVCDIVAESDTVFYIATGCQSTFYVNTPPTPNNPERIGRISKVTVTSANPPVLVSIEVLSVAKAFSLELHDGRLYSSSDKSLKSMTTSGTDVKTHIQGLDVAGVYAVAKTSTHFLIGTAQDPAAPAGALLDRTSETPDLALLGLS